jgi:hypothetical protein
MQRNAGQDAKVINPIGGYGNKNKLVVCRQCRNPINKTVSRGTCHCGGQLARVDGLDFFGPMKLSLVNEFRKKLGLLPKSKNTLPCNPKELFLRLVPRHHWSMDKLNGLNIQMLTIIIAYIPDNLSVVRNIAAEEYLSKGYKWIEQNVQIINDMFSELQRRIPSRS